MAHYQLNMAGIVWDIQSSLILLPDERCEPFLTEGKKPQVQMRYTLGHPEIRGSIHWDKNPRVVEDRTGYWVERNLAIRANPSACIYLNRDDPTRVEGWIYPEKKNEIRTIESLLDVSELEILLSRFGAVSLHSSFICLNDQAILFTAPSGTGKSTQADLWKKYRNAEIINGDRSIIRKTEQGWLAYGSPFAGSSAIYRNESAPIRAIVVLRQAEQNALRELNTAEAFRYLYSEMVISKWHSDAHRKIISQIERLAMEIPVLLLQCVPDETAVDVLNRYLDKQIPLRN